MAETWFLYIFCFHSPVCHAKHYTGITKDPERREKEHTSGQGSPLMAELVKCNIGYEFRVISQHKGYSEAKEAERKKKNNGGATKWCPVCKEKRRKF